MSQTDMEMALEQVRRAAMRDASREWPGMITSFMGLTPIQILKLRNFYREKTGREPETIE